MAGLDSPDKPGDLVVHKALNATSGLLKASSGRDGALQSPRALTNRGDKVTGPDPSPPPHTDWRPGVILFRRRTPLPHSTLWQSFHNQSQVQTAWAVSSPGTC